MSFDALRSPVQFLQQTRIRADQDWLREYETWFEREGQGISDAVDHAGTPWLHLFNLLGTRVDEILYPPGKNSSPHRGMMMLQPLASLVACETF